MNLAQSINRFVGFAFAPLQFLAEITMRESQRAPARIGLVGEDEPFVFDVTPVTGAHASGIGGNSACGTSRRKGQHKSNRRSG